MLSIVWFKQTDGSRLCFEPQWDALQPSRQNCPNAGKEKMSESKKKLSQICSTCGTVANVGKEWKVKNTWEQKKLSQIHSTCSTRTQKRSTWQSGKRKLVKWANAINNENIWKTVVKISGEMKRPEAGAGKCTR